MTNPQLADLIIERLNEIAMHDKEAMAKLIEQRVPCNEQLVEHPTVIAFADMGPPEVGMLGILNGIVGSIPDGPKKGWGYIAAVFDDDGHFLRFRRTDDPKIKPAGHVTIESVERKPYDLPSETKLREQAAARAIEDEAVFKAIDQFGMTLLTKRNRHIEVGFIDGAGYVYVNGEKVYPPPDEPA